MIRDEIAEVFKAIQEIKSKNNIDCNGNRSIAFARITPQSLDYLKRICLDPRSSYSSTPPSPLQSAFARIQAEPDANVYLDVEERKALSQHLAKKKRDLAKKGRGSVELGWLTELSNQLLQKRIYSSNLDPIAYRTLEENFKKAVKCYMDWAKYDGETLPKPDLNETRSFALSEFCSKNTLKELGYFDKETASGAVNTLVTMLLGSNDASTTFNAQYLRSMQEIKELIPIDQRPGDLFEQIAKLLEPFPLKTLNTLKENKKLIEENIVILEEILKEKEYIESIFEDTQILCDLKSDSHKNTILRGIYQMFVEKFPSHFLGSERAQNEIERQIKASTEPQEETESPILQCQRKKHILLKYLYKRVHIKDGAEMQPKHEEEKDALQICTLYKMNGGSVENETELYHYLTSGEVMLRDLSTEEPKNREVVRRAIEKLHEFDKREEREKTAKRRNALIVSTMSPERKTLNDFEVCNALR